MIEVKNLYKSYNKFQALKDISLSVKSGEICGLIGENSAGKTTLIKCMTGIYKPDKGIITYDGEAVYNNPSVKEKIGYVADANDYIGFYTISKMVYDNAPMERFYNTFKNELIYQNIYYSADTLDEAVSDYVFLWYNHVRPHSYNGGLTPFETRHRQE